MRDVINKLTPEQALEVVARLSDKGDGMREVVLAEARDVMREVDLDEVGEVVYFVLDSIDVQDCWDRAGSSRDGYTSPDEATVELIDEELQPYFDQARRYHELGMTKEETTYCKGVILGIYRYEHESKSEFRDWAVDIPLECAAALLTEWRKRGKNSRSAACIDDFIRDRCPKWTIYLIRTGRRV